MDSDITNNNNVQNKPRADIVLPKEEVGHGREEDELNSLLFPQKGGMSKRSKNARRKVQWNDRNGNKLVEVLEFQPSETSDDDDDDSDSCICTIM